MVPEESKEQGWGPLLPQRGERGNDPPDGMTLEEVEFRRLIAGFLGFLPDRHGQAGGPTAWVRRILVTEFAGAYHEPAGWVVVVEGSPPQGMVVVSPGLSSYIVLDEAKPQWRDADGIVRKFMLQCLHKIGKPPT